MAFKEHLKRIVDNADGAMAAVVMGFDGIAIESYDRPAAAGEGLDTQTMGIELAGLFGQVRNVINNVDSGTFKEISISTDKILAVARIMSGEYFVAVVLRADGNFGKARYLLRVVTPALEQEF
ncbi:MAG: hypothetical protein HYY84_18240 [Deltaproteobacteria bacterium]|nr:hypothetical protein [Deltaproteobacteria bacterium]